CRAPPRYAFCELGLRDLRGAGRVASSFERYEPCSGDDRALPERARRPFEQRRRALLIACALPELCRAEPAVRGVLRAPHVTGHPGRLAAITVVDGFFDEFRLALECARERLEVVLARGHELEHDLSAKASLAFERCRGAEELVGARCIPTARRELR